MSNERGKTMKLVRTQIDGFSAWMYTAPNNVKWYFIKSGSKWIFFRENANMSSQ